MHEGEAVRVLLTVLHWPWGGFGGQSEQSSQSTGVSGFRAFPERRRDKALDGSIILFEILRWA